MKRTLSLLLLLGCNGELPSAEETRRQPAVPRRTILDDTVCYNVPHGAGFTCTSVYEVPRSITRAECVLVPSANMAYFDAEILTPNLWERDTLASRLAYQRWFGLDDLRWGHVGYYRDDQLVGSVSMEPRDDGGVRAQKRFTHVPREESDLVTAMWQHDIQDDLHRLERDCVNRYHHAPANPGPEEFSGCHDCKWNRILALSAFTIGAALVIDAAPGQMKPAALVVLTPVGLLFEAYLSQMCEAECARALCEFKKNQCLGKADRLPEVQQDEAKDRCYMDARECFHDIIESQYGDLKAGSMTLVEEPRCDL